MLGQRDLVCKIILNRPESAYSTRKRRQPSTTSRLLGAKSTNGFVAEVLPITVQGKVQASKRWSAPLTLERRPEVRMSRRRTWKGCP